MNEIMKRPERSKMNGYKHSRNPSIRTLMKSKRFESAAPKHNMMEDIIFSPHPDIEGIGDLETVSKSTPRIQRLESVIHRLRIENSHVLSKADTLESKTTLLHKTLKHSKQQYAILESETKKLKQHNRYLQQQLDALQHKTTKHEEEDIAHVGHNHELQNLKDIQRKTVAKNKKIKRSLEDMINDPGLPFYLRSKLLSLLPQFYTTQQGAGTSPSSVSAQMKLDFVESDDEPLPHPSPPTMHPSHSEHTQSKKPMHYKKRKLRNGSSLHRRNLSESVGMREYTTQLMKPSMPVMSRESHQRSVSNTSQRCNIDSMLSKTRRASLSVSDPDDQGFALDDLLDDILQNDMEDLMKTDDEEEEKEKETRIQQRLPIALPKSVPPPRAHKDTATAPHRHTRPKKPPPPPVPPPPPRRNHAAKAHSAHLSPMGSASIANIQPSNHLNLTQINEDVHPTNRLRSSSATGTTTGTTSAAASSSPPKLIRIALETPQAVSTDDDYDMDAANYRNNLKSIQKRGRSNKRSNRKKAYTAWNPHMRSKSHQPPLRKDDADTMNSANLYMPPSPTRPHTRSKLFHIDLGWSSKKRKRESINTKEKENRDSDTQSRKESFANTLLRNKKKKKKKKRKKGKDGLELSMTSSIDEEDMNDAVMNVNPLSPIHTNHGTDRFPGFSYNYKEHMQNGGGLLSSPDEMSAVSPSSDSLEPFLTIKPVLQMSVSTPSSPLRNRKKKKKSEEEPKPNALLMKKQREIPTAMARMDHIQMAKLQKKQNINNARQKRFYSAAPAINISNINTIKKNKHNLSPLDDSPVPGYHLTRRSSMKDDERRQKTDGAFEFLNHHNHNNKIDTKRKRKQEKRSRKSNHTRSVSLRGLKSDKWSFSLSSPRSRGLSKSKSNKKDSSPRKKGAGGFAFGHHRRRGGSRWSNDSDGSGDSDDLNKVWTLKDLIGEMVSNHSDEDDHRMRNALILCHSTFTSSVALFEELRRFFRMSITVMTSTILYFEDEDDDAYISQEDRRWQMRRKITQCIVYWIKEFWTQDFATNQALQTEIELFKSDVRTCIHDVHRSKQLIEPLMAALTDINKTYGGINPKNLNLPRRNRAQEDDEILLLEEDDKEEEYELSASESDSEYETSVVIHDDIISDDEAEEDAHEDLKKTQEIIKEKKEDQTKEELEALTASIGSVSVRFPDLIQLDIAVPHGFNIMELDPEDVAVQLTLLDSFVFQKICDRECIEQNWKKKDKAIKAPNVLKMIAQFNNVSKWVQMTILRGETPRLRKRYIKKTISMARYFMQHGNLSSLCAFYNALTSSNIAQLHASWKLLSKSKRRELQEIKSLFGWKMNKFKEMQDELVAPCIPHIGIILQTLFQIDEGKQNKNPINGGVNYIKMMMLHQQIDNMKQLQSKHYTDEPNFLIQKLLIQEFERQYDISETALYKLAKQVSTAEKNHPKK